MSAGENLLEVQDLAVRYGKVEALRGVHMRVGRGRIVTVIGPNGAGKTTLLSAIVGFLPCASGRVAFDGTEIAGAAVEDNVARGLSLVPETRELFTRMTVQDNLLLGSFSQRRARRRERDSLLDEVFGLFPRLRERRTQVAGSLSGGERQMLALGRALMGRPRLLLLDEPSLGLAPLVAREIFRMVVELRRRGVTILLVEQNARAALQIADDAYLLETGEVSLSGTAQALAGDARVIESYLGFGRQTSSAG